MDNIPDDLRATFDALFAEAVTAGEPVPTAMTLATAVDGQPSARTVLLKAFDARGFVFYTHLDGRKGRELQANPRASRTVPFVAKVIGEPIAKIASRIMAAWDGALSNSHESCSENGISGAGPSVSSPVSRRRNWCSVSRVWRVPAAAAASRVLVRRAVPPARALAARTRRGRHLVQADAVSVSGPAGG